MSPKTPPNYASASAPLPSPTVGQGHPSSSSTPSSYFANIPQQRAHSTTTLPQQQAPTSYPSQASHTMQAPTQHQYQSINQHQCQQQAIKQQQQQQQQQTQTMLGAGGQQQQMKSSGSGQYCIIAEAAKKAEMAVMMRDFGEVGI